MTSQKRIDRIHTRAQRVIWAIRELSIYVQSKPLCWTVAGSSPAVPTTVREDAYAFRACWQRRDAPQGAYGRVEQW